MKVFIFLACSILGVNAVSFFDLVMEEWHVFKLQYKKSYSSDSEEKFRMKVFMDNKHKIAAHNARYERGEVSYKLGLNQFSDLLHTEAIQRLNGYNGTRASGKRGSFMKKQGSTFIPPANYEVPYEVNWVSQGAVTPVKNQGSCGSCWAFSATGALEGQHFRKSGVLISLSEQNLVDCSTPEGNDGCNGGLMDQAFLYVKDNNGIDTEKSYPYTASAQSTCKYNPKTSGATDTGFVDVTSGNERALKRAVATVGPISVAIDASQPTFMQYTGGVYSDPQCSSTELDHGVLVVGYGVDSDTNEEYWLIKNSWGTTWGENGFIRMARNRGNMCGVATAASYPLV